MSSTFGACMYCACNEEGITIYKCYDCGAIYCKVCAEHSFFSTKCPGCDSRHNKKLGYIQPA